MGSSSNRRLNAYSESTSALAVRPRREAKTFQTIHGIRATTQEI